MKTQINHEKLKDRINGFLVQLTEVISCLPDSDVAVTIEKQLKSHWSLLHANYCATWEKISNADYLSTLRTLREAIEESSFWLWLIIEGRLIDENYIEPLLAEANEITAIITSSIKSGKN